MLIEIGPEQFDSATLVDRIGTGEVPALSGMLQDQIQTIVSFLRHWISVRRDFGPFSKTQEIEVEW